MAEEKSVADQIDEIVKLLADSQERQDQARWALQTLRERLERDATGSGDA